MKTELIQKILENEPQVKLLQPGVYRMSEELDVTAFFDMGHETLNINRVRQLSFLAEFLTIETYKGERFYVGPDTPLKGLKFGEPESKKIRGAGFTVAGA